ncbi:hypothetical protein Tco_0171650, partial [Tanacetum coccineum]
MSRRVESFEDQASLGVLEDASKQGRSIEDIDVDVDVSLVDGTQERQDDDLIIDYEVLEVDVMHVEAKDGKDNQSKKLDDSTAGIDDNTAGEAVTTVGIDDTAGINTSSSFHKIVDANVEKRNQPRARMTMGELILNKKGSLRKQSQLKHNLRQRDTLITSISGPRRKLFYVDDDEWENTVRSQ